MPRALISLGPGALLDRDALQERLRRGDPPVELSNAGGGDRGDRGASGAPGVYVNPQDLREGDEVLVAAALQGALDPAGAASGLQMTGATS
jgi:hypothetical protein